LRFLSLRCLKRTIYPLRIRYYSAAAAEAAAAAALGDEHALPPSSSAANNTDSIEILDAPSHPFDAVVDDRCLQTAVLL
jgi:hypothetical protein